MGTDIRQKYFKVSHEFAIKQAIEKIKFEIKLAKDLFNEDVSE